MAIVIPLGLKHRNTYLSYNMEANFYLQYFDTIQGIVPPIFAKARDIKIFWLCLETLSLFQLFRNYFQIDEPNVNAGSVIFYASQSDQRKLEDDSPEKVNDLDEENSNATTIQPDFKVETNLENTVTEFTVEVEHPPSVSFKKTISKQSDSANGREDGKKTDDKKKKKKHRINREILSTILSRKKFYKILIQKMDM